VGGLIQATDGNFYGTLTFGGAGTEGSLYRLTPAGVFTKLHDFRTQTGSYPQSTLLQHTSGKLYGITTDGGTYGSGVIFEYDAGLGPFVTFLNVYGQVGAKVDILGEYFDAGSIVSFNGVPAQNPVIQCIMRGRPCFRRKHLWPAQPAGALPPHPQDLAL
jgi:uncharacterized repeat protein (TIGR03803 family)